MLSKLIAPVYNTMGKRVTTNEIIKKKATKERVNPSNRFSKNCGMMVNLILRYLGTKYTAVKIKAKAEVTSQEMMIKPFL